MSITGRIKGAYKALTAPNSMISNNVMGGSFGYGVPFTWGVSGALAYNNKIFYSAMNILVNKLTEAPILFSKKDQGKKSKLNKIYSPTISNEERAMIKALGLTEQGNSPVDDLFNNCNDYQSRIELMQDFWYNYGFGDGFLYFESLDPELSRNTLPIAIHSLRRDRVIPMYSNDRFNPIASYEYTTHNGETLRIPSSNILHLKRWNPFDGQLKGLGINVAACMDIALNEANNEAQGSAFRNGGRGTMFSSDVANDGNNGIVDKMSAPQMSALKDSVMKDYQGAKNYRKMHFTNGKVDVQAYGDTLAEMELVASEETNWKNIYSIAEVPWVLSPVSSSVSENTVIVGYKSLVTNTCLPKIRNFDQKLTQKIEQWWPQMIAVTDVTEFSELAPDLKLMKETYGSPLLTTDELRAVYSYDSIGGDVGSAILVPSGMMKIQDIINNDFADVPNPNDPNAPNKL